MMDQTKWSELLIQAVSQPGLILKAYSAFHGYSLGNRIAAMFQCAERGINPGPLNTYPGWQTLNRQVKKGEKAIWLCMPITHKKKDESGEAQTIATNFMWKPKWFVMSQTSGLRARRNNNPGLMRAPRCNHIVVVTTQGEAHTPDGARASPLFFD
jgi:hypothetical protein